MYLLSYQCVHCKALEPTWEQLATKLKPQGLKVAKINGVSEKVLLARFRIEAFPSIFHIAGGETREYNGGRSLEALEQFAQTRWRKEDPLPIWRNPAHIISRGLGHVYGLPALLQKAYHHFNRDLGYSELTILVGALSIPLALGIFSICLLDAFYSCRTEPVALVAEHPHND